MNIFATVSETAFCCKNFIKKIFFSELSDDTGYRFKLAGTGWPQIIKKNFFKIESHLQKVCQLSYRQGY